MSEHENLKKGLLYTENKDLSKKLNKQLEGLDFQLEEEAATQEMISKITENNYDLLLIDNDHSDNSELAGTLLNLLQNMDIAKRRKTFIILFGNDLETEDERLAFAFSFNLICNTKDLENFTGTFEHASKKFNKVYVVFNELFNDYY